MLLSVIIPAFNAGFFIGDALKSVLDQAHEPLEIFVVDDGSTDDTAERVRVFGHPSVRYIYQKNQGPGVARNRGIRESSGPVLGFLDADDLWAPGGLRRLLDRLEKSPQPDIVMGLTEHRPLGGGAAQETGLIPYFGSALIRRAAFDKVGLLNETLRFSEDHDWFLRAKEAGIPIVALKDVTLIQRRHPDSMTSGLDWKKAGILRVLKNSLDRRRARNKGDAGTLPKLSDFSE